jgi:membrane protease YdiL (CAAX protease family)
MTMNGSADGEGLGPAVRENNGSGPGGDTANWWKSKWLAVGELSVVAVIFVVHKHLHFFGTTPYLLLFGLISLRVRKLRWRDIGLKRFRNWKITVGLGVAAGLLFEGFELFVSQPLLMKLLRTPPHFEDFRSLTGNLKLTLISLVLTWTLAAFGEEMVYRGYLMNRVADLMNRTRVAWIISLIVVHVGFGIAHGYQGIVGVIDEGLQGMLLGLLYLRTERNLSVPIIAHGIADTCDVVLIFLGKYPGL